MLCHSSGFRPRRSIVLGSWDAEEYSLLGSTHFAESIGAAVGMRPVAYINADCPVKGRVRFCARADELLSEAIIRSARLVKVDPDAGQTLFQYWLQNNVDGIDQDGNPM